MRTTQQLERKFQSPRELAIQTGKAYRTIHRAIKAGKIRIVWFGGSIMIPADEVKRVLEHGWK